MKTSSFLTITILFVLYSCNSVENTNAQKVTFGIYETIKVKDLPASVTNFFKATNITLEKDSMQPILGYLPKGDSAKIQADFSKENIKLVKTYYTIDKEGKYIALIAVKLNPAIINSDIQKTKNKNRNVEIYFNYGGAKKWAELTKNNIGNAVAFTIDEQIYTMPYVNAEIVSGTALINGLENDAKAEKLAATLNSSISK